MSEDSSSEVMELDENATEPNIEQNLRQLQEEEKRLRQQQAIMEAGNGDDIGALEIQDALRLNQIKQNDLHKQAQRLLRYQDRQERLERHDRQELQDRHDRVDRLDRLDRLDRPEREAASSRRDHTAPRRRAACTVRVNNLHGAEAIETDV